MANFDPINFLQEVKQIVTGNNNIQGSTSNGIPFPNVSDDGGFLVDVDISSRIPSTLTSTATSTISTLFITRDYDQASDNAMLRLICSTSTAGNPTISTSVALTIWNPNISTTSTSTTVAQISSTAFVSSTITNYGVDFSGNGLQYGDVISLALSTTGGNLGLIGAAFTYSSDLVAYQDYGSPQTTVSITTGLATAPNSVLTETVNGSTYEIRTR
jgi:hypothetical protein